MLKLKCYYGLFLLCALTACTAKKPLNQQDPLEPLNRKIYQFNKTFDALYLNPVVKVYANVVPAPIRKLITNFFNNITEVPVIINNLLQARFYQAIDSTARFTLNTTLGIGGLFDVASHSNLKYKKTDFGQTLYRLGYKKSIYLVLPIIGPTTIRDGIGLCGDSLVSIPYHFKTKWRNRYAASYVINRKSNLTEFQSFINVAGVDEYILFRDAYLQNRKYVFGEIDPEDALDENIK